jgi:meso-butanediol dehydrogenase/(S,S)-butanediol dehydrogenase/diacetyl reductase
VQRFHDEGALGVAVDRYAKTLGRLAPDSERWATHLSDVSIKGASAPLIAACVARFGRLDILANIAGVSNSKPAHETSEDDLDIGSTGIFRPLFVCRAMSSRSRAAARASSSTWRRALGLLA